MDTPTISIVDNLDPGIHSHGESKADDHEKEEITNLLEDPPESAAESNYTRFYFLVLLRNSASLIS